SPYQYIMSRDFMTWYDAQNYCRTKYIDLATIENLDDDNTIFSLYVDGVLSFMDFASTEASGFIFISEAKSWTEAQSFCRQNYTDLASVRNDAENQQIQSLIPTGGDAWIGLFRDTWKWSDKSSLSFTFWAPGEPNNNLGRSENCGQIYIYNGYPGYWNDLYCTFLLPFFCYAGKFNWS
uniref:C-type lectin domain-containing protein n=1 Tax=Denticeps clupeoides TaxID=299321 RepID=A0AAY4DHS4_9TELE